MTQDQISTILYRLSQQDKTLSEIHAHVKKTNGRVTDLEKREYAEIELKKYMATKLAKRAFRLSWITPAIAGVGATLGSALLAHWL
jgi:hypothetical protein